jgi:hypothetical protein
MRPANAISIGLGQFRPKDQKRRFPKSDQAMGGVKTIECLFLERDFSDES